MKTKLVIVFSLLSVSVYAQPPKKLAVILWTKTSTTPERTNDYIKQYFTNLGNYWAEQSYNKVTFSPTDVFGPYLNHPEVPCLDQGAMKQLAVPNGYVEGNYWQTLTLAQDCHTSDGYNEDIGSWPMLRDLFQHVPIEMGYVLGIFPGAGSLTCKNSNGNFQTIGGNCTAYQYGDLGPTGSGDDIGLGHYPAGNKTVAGWIDPARIQNVTTSGTYTIKPLEVPTNTGIQLLNIQTGGIWTGNLYQIEYRQPSQYEFIGEPNFYNGAIIRSGYLIDGSPDGLFGPNGGSPTLLVGRTLYDSINQISVTPLSATATELQVQVTFGAVACTHANPTVTVTPQTQIGAPGGSVNYDVTVTNNDSPGCITSDFGLVQLSFNTTTPFTLSPGQTSTKTVTVNSGNTPIGTYPINITAINTSSTAFSANTSVNYSLSPVGSSVNYVSTDVVTLGNWHGVYGRDGVASPADVIMLPQYAQLTASAGTPIWNFGSSSDIHLLQTVNSNSRILGGWGLYTNSFSLDLNLTDGQQHKISMYFYAGGCGDSVNNSETIEFVDAINSSVVLDTRQTTTGDGRWLIYNVKGHVKINVKNGHCGVLMNALMFN